MPHPVKGLMGGGVVEPPVDDTAESERKCAPSLRIAIRLIQLGLLIACTGIAVCSWLWDENHPTRWGWGDWSCVTSRLGSPPVGKAESSKPKSSSAT